MPIDVSICKNNNCKKEYVISDTDDGYCSFECWEKINCGEPKIISDIFDTKDIFDITKISV